MWITELLWITVTRIYVWHMNEGDMWLRYISAVCTCELVMTHAWTSHVTKMDESCHTYGSVMSHKCASTSAIQLRLSAAFVQHMSIWGTRLQHTAKHCNTCTTCSWHQVPFSCVWVPHSCTTLSERNPPLPGDFFCWAVSKSRTRRKRNPPEEPPQKLINFGGGSSGGFLFLPVFDQGT